MLFSRTAKEIRGGLWAVNPFTGIASLQLAKQILAGETRKESSHKAEARIHYLVDSSGKTQNTDLSEIPPDSIAVVEIIGNMIRYGNYFCYGADELVSIARMYDEHPNIIGQIWIIDSGGGSVSAVGPYIDFLKEKQKPVLAYCDLCASAAYWIASNTDYVMAQNDISSMFGSIGVMATLFNYEKYYEALGIKEHVIYADPSGDKNKEFTNAIKGDYKLIKKLLLNPLAIRFQDMVKSNRKGKLDPAVDGLLTGSMFFAKSSISNGLADGIGTMREAIIKVKELAAVQSFMIN